MLIIIATIISTVLGILKTDDVATSAVFVALSAGFVRHMRYAPFWFTKPEVELRALPGCRRTGPLLFGRTKGFAVAM